MVLMTNNDDTGHMTKIREDNIICPNCNSHSIDILALSAITCIFMCRECRQSFGLKWLSDSDIDKVKKTAEFKQRHPDYGNFAKNDKKPWLRI